MSPAAAKEQLAKEIEELKQNKEELEVRMNALKSQYEGRLLRLDRELREAQAHSDTKDEPLDQSGAKVLMTVYDRPWRFTRIDSECWT